MPLLTVAATLSTLCCICVVQARGSIKPAAGYVPKCLRRQRTSLAPQQFIVELQHEQWVVPQFSSTAGFENGLFDEANEISYFD